MFHTNVVDKQPLVAPFGGREARCGTNPYTCGVPWSGQPGGIVLDFATSVMANGKLKDFLNKAESLPDHVVLDKHGNPSNDPAETFRERVEDKGCILPFGGHKGSGLMFVIELLAGAVTGGGTLAPQHARHATAADTGCVNSCLAVAFDPKRFGDHDTPLHDEITNMAHYYKSSSAQLPGSAVLLPGEKENLTSTERRRHGIPVPAVTWNKLVQAATDMGVDDAVLQQMQEIE